MLRFATWIIAIYLKSLAIFFLASSSHFSFMCFSVEQYECLSYRCPSISEFPRRIQRTAEIPEQYRLPPCFPQSDPLLLHASREDRTQRTLEVQPRVSLLS